MNLAASAESARGGPARTISALMPLWLEWIALVIFAVAAPWIGRRVFARTEHRMRVRATLGQH